MAAFLKANPKIDLLFAHNDDMGLGAIEAIEEAGLKPGKDIKIVTIDAVHDGMVALSQGKINFIAECSPLLGPQLMALVKQVVAGQARSQADRDQGDDVHPGSGQGGSPDPEVLATAIPEAAGGHFLLPPAGVAEKMRRDERAQSSRCAGSTRRSAASRPSTPSTSASSRARSTR